MPKRTSFDSLENMAVFLDFTVVDQIFMSGDGQLFFHRGMRASRKGLAQPRGDGERVFAVTLETGRRFLQQGFCAHILLFTDKA